MTELSKTVYLVASDFEPSLSYEDSFRITRVQLHLKTGQPLEYYDEMTVQDMNDILAVLDGTAKAQAEH